MAGGFSSDWDVSFLLLRLRTQAKVFHWQTRRYSDHKTLDWLVERLAELTDRWVEAFQGRDNGRVSFSCGSLRLRNLDDEEMTSGQVTQTVQYARASLVSRQKQYFASESPLSNLIDEIVSVLDKTLYLLSLR